MLLAHVISPIFAKVMLIEFGGRLEDRFHVHGTLTYSVKLGKVVLFSNLLLLGVAAAVGCG